MINVHKSAYQKVYNEFSSVFIDAYCGYKCSGLNTSEALNGAKIDVQLKMSLEIKNKRLDSTLVLRAYDNIRNDSQLIQRAIQYYQGIKGN